MFSPCDGISTVYCVGLVPDIVTTDVSYDVSTTSTPGLVPVRPDPPNQEGVFLNAAN